MLVIFITSCKKDDPFPVKQQYVKGIVYDKVTKQPLSNTKVYLCKARILGSVKLEYYDIIDEYLTDSTGKFYFNYTQGNDLIGVYAKKNDSYFDYQTVKDIGDYNRDSCNFNLKPKGWQVFHIRNINPVNDSDLIEFESKYLLYGINIDTIIIIENHYDFISPTIWSVTKDGFKNNYFEYFDCIPHDTTFHTINY